MKNQNKTLIIASILLIMFSLFVIKHAEAAEYDCCANYTDDCDCENDCPEGCTNMDRCNIDPGCTGTSTGDRCMLCWP